MTKIMSKSQIEWIGNEKKFSGVSLLPSHFAE